MIKTVHFMFYIYLPQFRQPLPSTDPSSGSHSLNLGALPAALPRLSTLSVGDPTHLHGCSDRLCADSSQILTSSLDHPSALGPESPHIPHGVPQTPQAGRATAELRTPTNTASPWPRLMEATLSAHPQGQTPGTCLRLLPAPTHSTSPGPQVPRPTHPPSSPGWCRQETPIPSPGRRQRQSLQSPPPDSKPSDASTKTTPGHRAASPQTARPSAGDTIPPSGQGSADFILGSRATLCFCHDYSSLPLPRKSCQTQYGKEQRG